MRASAVTWASEISDSELARLTALLKSERLSGPHLEIGTAAGGTLKEMMRCYPDSRRPKFVVVDPMTYFDDQLRIVRDNLSSAGLAPDDVEFRLSKSWPAFLAAAVAGMFCYYGFEACGDVAEETPNASREIPKAMRMTIYVGGGAAMFVCLALVLSIPDLPAVLAGRVADPVATTHHGDGSVGRTEQPQTLGPRRGAQELAGKAHRLVMLAGRHHEGRQPSERRQAALLAHLELVRVEGLAVLSHHRLHHRMGRMVGLEERPAGFAGPPRPAGHLGQDLEGLLGGARVAMRQPQIGIEHPDL